MKKNKILIPALAVLALGVAGATTGTVAWYQTVQSLTPKIGTAEGYEVSVNGPSETAASFDYTISCEITDSHSDKTLILSQYVTSAYKSYTLDAGLQKVEYTPGDNEELVKVFVVTAKGAWGADSADLSAEAKAAILAANNQTYTVTFSKDNTCAARAMFVTQASSTIGNFSNVSDQTLTKAVKDIPTTGVEIGYLLVRVDGENTNQQGGNVADTDPFTVKINATGSVA